MTRPRLYDADCPPGRMPEVVARPIRTIEIHTFPRMTDEEVAALFGLPFLGEVKS